MRSSTRVLWAARMAFDLRHILLYEGKRMMEWLWWPFFTVTYFVVVVHLAQFYGQLLKRDARASDLMNR